MRLSGEYRSTGRPAEVTPAMLDRIGEVLRLFDVRGLAKQVLEPAGPGEARPILGGIRQASLNSTQRSRRTLPA